jgi:hypothetical protein
MRNGDKGGGGMLMRGGGRGAVYCEFTGDVKEEEEEEEDGTST